MAKLSGAILLLVVLGTPLVAYVWHTLNDLLSGHFYPVRLLLAMPAVALLVMLFGVIARVIGRLDAQHVQLPAAEETSHEHEPRGTAPDGHRTGDRRG